MGENVSLLINIDVGDLPRAVEFYSGAFGLRPGRRFGGEGIEMLGASSVLYLLVKPPGSSPSPATSQLRGYERHWTPVHLDMVVDDLDAAVAKARLAGASQEGVAQTHNWGRIAYMADPFGNGFCLLQFLGRGYDEIADPPVGETRVLGRPSRYCEQSHQPESASWLVRQLWSGPYHAPFGYRESTANVQS